MAFDRRNEGAALRADVPDNRVPAVWNLKPLHGFQPGIEQGVAFSENADLDMVWASRHAFRLTQLRSKTVAPRSSKCGSTSASRREAAAEPKAGQRI
jgi:hypothetical protein